ncbi:hypothetical protein J2W22_003002 [Sphingomonas kyeonggiensis]|uniref:hypothetical protein n=1 Tax=Sphingomonas kyeonggiensis TaxID=1268553 RepID=UPI0027838D72|nr:hypothetical protein [Sphingomonas kyeonggiensis]MDQ0250938.1 hypothetical protein [Sphingomonas kyeonggiensis]
MVIQRRRGAVHPMGCTCGVHKPRRTPSDGSFLDRMSLPGIFLLGLSIGLLLIATLAGPKAALLAATGIVWAG